MFPNKCHLKTKTETSESVPWSFWKALLICVVPTLDFPKGLEGALLGLEAAMYSGHIH